MDTRKLSGNITSWYPTIASLSAFATRTALACFRSRTESSLARCLEMTEMARSHSLNFPVHQPSITQPRDDVILITGTTGLFGTNLLAQFLQCPKVKTVYGLNHKKSRPGSVVEKQASLLQACGLDPALARHPKLTLIDADASQSHFGLSEELYEQVLFELMYRHVRLGELTLNLQLLVSVTHIVHNAWLSTYDDSLSLNIFDGSFHMLRNLVDLALSSPLPAPPRLLFISSIDTLRGASSFLDDSESEKTGAVALEGPVSVCDAVGNPRGKSKWVGEQILAAAASETPLRPIIVRVGPLCGATNGRWREEAHLPMIVHLGVALGALPKVNEVKCPHTLPSSPLLTTHINTQHRSSIGYRSTLQREPSQTCVAPHRYTSTSRTLTPFPRSPSYGVSAMSCTSRSSPSRNGPPNWKLECTRCRCRTRPSSGTTLR